MANNTFRPNPPTIQTYSDYMGGIDISDIMMYACLDE
jgi:hypothetical protein